MEKQIFFYPTNGYLLVSRADNFRHACKTEFTSPVKKDKERIAVVEIIAVDGNCRFAERINQKAAVLESMIEDIKYKQETFLIVPESAVFGFVFDESEMKIEENLDKTTSTT